jgi:hypothetical protein
LKCGFGEIVGDNNFHDGTRLGDVPPIVRVRITRMLESIISGSRR